MLILRCIHPVQPRLVNLQKQTPTYMQKMTRLWQSREIDNYTYLMHLNRVAGAPHTQPLGV